MPVTRVSAEPLHPAGAGVAPKKSDPLLEQACREFVRQTNKAGEPLPVIMYHAMP